MYINNSYANKQIEKNVEKLIKKYFNINSINGKKINSVPVKLEDFKSCKPIYEELDGWQTDISDVREIEGLPENALKYIKRIEALVGVEISMVSVGSGREQMIHKRDK